ncbi:MAG TPA: hypothetical protein VLF88_01415 [Candidatus Babeliales bacterium]|nr:hypothetical protein [Candidatus Babeliales bacterium]
MTEDDSAPQFESGKEAKHQRWLAANATGMGDSDAAAEHLRRAEELDALPPGIGEFGPVAPEPTPPPADGQHEAVGQQHESPGDALTMRSGVPEPLKDGETEEAEQKITDTPQSSESGNPETAQASEEAAEGVGGVAASSVVKDAAYWESRGIKPDAPYQESRGRYEKEFKDIAEARHKSRPLTERIVEKVRQPEDPRGPDYKPVDYRDVAHEEALELDYRIDSELMSAHRRKSGGESEEPIQSRQEMADRLETRDSQFNGNRGTWKESDWDFRQKKLDRQMAPHVEQISSSLDSGELDKASEVFQQLSLVGREYIEQRFGRRVPEMAATMISERDSEGFAALLKTPFAAMLFRENLKVSDEQLKASEIQKAVVERAAEFTRNVFDFDDKAIYGERARSTGLLFRLETRLKTLSKIGVCNMAELLSAPEVRQAALEAVMEEKVLYDDYQKENPRGLDGIWVIDKLAELGLTSVDEIAESQQYKDAVMQEILDQISSANCLYPSGYDKGTKVNVFGEVMKKVGNWGIDAATLKDIPEVQKAVEEFFDEATRLMSEFKDTSNIKSHSKPAFEGYSNKIQALIELGLLNKDDLASHAEFTQQMQRQLDAIRTDAEAQRERSLDESRRLAENADEPLKAYESLEQIGKDLGIAA